MMPEPKENENQEMDLDTKIDSIIDFHGKVKPEDSSSSKETVDKETDESEGAGADQQKTAKPEDKKEDLSKEGKDPRDLAFRKGYNQMKAKSEKEIAELKKQLEEIPSKEEIEAFKTMSQSPEYIRARMKAEGYRDEVIDNKLREIGHSVPEKGSDIDIVVQKLGIDTSKLESGQKAALEDVIDIASVLIEEKFGKLFPEKIKSLQENVDRITSKNSASSLMKQMRAIIDDEKILSFEEDIEPKMHEWIDRNPEGTQDELFDYFKDINHKLSLEYVQAKGKRNERAKKKESLPKEKITVNTEGKPQLTGDFDKDFDAIYNALTPK